MMHALLMVLVPAVIVLAINGRGGGDRMAAAAMALTRIYRNVMKYRNVT
jgi:hypothetical protein